MEARRLPDTVPAFDPEAFDRQFTYRFSARVGKVLTALFRLKVEGLEHLDFTRPALLVANHNIGCWGILDVLAIYYTWYCLQPSPPDLVTQGEKLVLNAPCLGHTARRIGIALASLEGMRAPLCQGRWIFTTPGALVDQFRPFWLRKSVRLQKVAWLNGRPVFSEQLGYARVAAEGGYPIYPVAISGTYGMSPVLWESPQLLRWLGLHRLRREENWPSFPITLNHVINLLVFLCTPFAASLWAWIIFLLANVYIDFVFLYPLFPCQIKLSVGQPVKVSKVALQSTSSGARYQLYRSVHAQVVASINGMLHDLDETYPWKRLWRRLRHRLSGSQ